MRHRKVDRAILEQNEPLDSDDQDLVISLLTAENDLSLKLYKKILALSILVEIPPLVLLARGVSQAPLLKVAMASLIVLLNFLTLVNTIFEVESASRLFPPLVRKYLGKLMHFRGLCGLNVVLLVQMIYVAFWREQLGWMGVFTVVPIGNLVTLVLLKYWHQGVEQEVAGLHALKYKYKNV